VVSALADSLKAPGRGRPDHPDHRGPAFEGRYQQIKDDFNGAIDSLRDRDERDRRGDRRPAPDPTRSPAASDDLSRRTEQQAASLEETAAALDQITATVRRSAEGAKSGLDAASSAPKPTPPAPARSCARPSPPWARSNRARARSPRSSA
jgi:methyl-accepting chemotaxis protein